VLYSPKVEVRSTVALSLTAAYSVNGFYEFRRLPWILLTIWTVTIWCRFGPVIPKIRYSKATIPINPNTNPGTVEHICTVDLWNSKPVLLYLNSYDWSTGRILQWANLSYQCCQVAVNSVEKWWINGSNFHVRITK